MTGCGASRSLPGAPAKVSSLCFADLHHQNLRPGEPPEGQLDGGEGTKVAKVSVRFSKSLARRRLRPNQEKVRSTTQRRGKTTKPFMSSLRLTISVRSGGTFATAASTCQAL